VVLVIYPKVLSNRDLSPGIMSTRRPTRVRIWTYIVYASSAILVRRLAVTNQAVGPHPVDVLHSAAGLLSHYIAEACPILSFGAVRDGKIQARVITVEKHSDVEDLRRAVGLQRQWQSSIGRYVQRDMKRVYVPYTLAARQRASFFC
jgi:hypothetical protein